MNDQTEQVEDMPEGDDPAGMLDELPGGDMSGGAGDGEDDPGAEDSTPQRRCATMDVHRRMLTESPGYATARAKIENFVAAMASSESGAVSRASVGTIPVVVHVLFNNAAQNLSDAQIESQIRILNEDYRASNADLSQVPGVFEDLIGDAKIEFALATEDPDGNPHSGVIRKSTTVSSFGSDDKMKFDSSGGSDAWDATKYLNMWACRLGGGLLGYAQFPGGAPETDGVVMLDTAFGDTGTAAAPFDKGRTATHEVGHWLDVFHIWGDDGTGCSGSDEVADTPNQGGPNVGCPTFPKTSCSNGPNGDLFMNYMDYVDDGCMVMFTKGQIARMDAALAGPRAGLLQEEEETGSPGTSGPVVSWGDKRLDPFVIGQHSGVAHKWWNGDWGPSDTGFEAMGGSVQGTAEAVSWGPDRLDVFVKDTGHSLQHKWWNGSAWGPSMTGYESLGGVIRGNPNIVAWGPKRLDVFAVGTNSGLYHKWWNGSWGPSTSGYEYLGGAIRGNPKAVAWSEKRLDVFVVGMNSGLYHKWWGGSWGPSLTGYEFLGGRLQSDPEVVSWGPKRLDVFAVGTDSRLYHKWWDGSWGPSTTGWEDLGGVIVGQPQAVAWGPDRLDVFAVGSNSQLLHKWWNGSSWGPSVTGWEDLGGKIIGDPHAVAWGPKRLDVFAVGTGSRLAHKWWNGSAWGPSTTGWEDMGGTVTAF